MRSLAQVQLAESSVLELVKRNWAKSVKAGHCTADVPQVQPGFSSLRIKPELGFYLRFTCSGVADC